MALELKNTSNKLWIWTQGSFKPVQLPKGVSFSPNRIQALLELDPTKILMYADVEEGEEDKNPYASSSWILPSNFLSSMLL